jgi:hypothetical protein
MSLSETPVEIAARTSAQTLWLAKPWLAAGAITEVMGKIKAAGKTTWTLALCKQVLEGGVFLGERCFPASIVYLTEQPPTSFRKALERARLLNSRGLHVVFHNKVVGQPWPLVADMVLREADRYRAGVIVVDTLAPFANMHGDSENSAGAALEAMRPLQQWASTHRGVISVRHERKAGGDTSDAGRGSSALSGAADIVLTLRRVDGNRPRLRQISSVGRFDETPDKLMVTLNDEGEYEAVGDSDAAAQATRQRVLAALPTTEAAALPVKTLHEAVADLGRTQLYDILKSLVDDGAARRTGSGKAGDATRYWRTA